MSTRLRIDELIHHERGDQDVLVFETTAFARVLALDGVIQVTSGDEYIYHETMAHTPFIARGRSGRVLIIGGGDGGIAREVLRQPGLDSLTMVEIDAGVIETCRNHMPGIAAGAFDDPRLELIIGDGAEFVTEAAPHSFDVIIVDSTDPAGPGAVLFTTAFYKACRRVLRPDGIMISQNGMPLLQSGEVASAFGNLRSAFGDDRVSACSITVPSYTGGPMLLGLSSAEDFRMPGRETLLVRAKALPSTMKFLTAESLPGALALAPEHLAIVRGT